MQGSGKQILFCCCCCDSQLKPHRHLCPPVIWGLWVSGVLSAPSLEAAQKLSLPGQPQWNPLLSSSWRSALRRFRAAWQLPICLESWFTDMCPGGLQRFYQELMHRNHSVVHLSGTRSFLTSVYCLKIYGWIRLFLGFVFFFQISNLWELFLKEC